MIDITNYMPEAVLLSLILVSALFLIKHTWTKKSIRLMNIFFVLGAVACAYFVVSEIVLEKQDVLKNIFKLYFLSAAIYYIYIYSRRFHALERLCIASLCMGSFLAVSNTDIFIMLVSFSLCMISVYGLAVTRERPSKDAVTFTSFLFITAALYGLHPFFATTIMLISVMFLCLRTTNKDLEAVSVTFLLPALIYLLLRELLTIDRSMLISNSLTTIGIVSMIISSILLIANSNRSKNMAKFAVFYLGSIIFMMGCGTFDIKAAVIMMTLLFAFTYSPVRNPLTILTLAMLPPITAFVVKIPLFWAPFKTGMIAQILLVCSTSLVIAVFSGIELYRTHVSKENKAMPVPIALKFISIAVIIISVVYFDRINLTLEYAIKALGK